jgi:zinc transport system substrate-binding protein
MFAKRILIMSLLAWALWSFSAHAAPNVVASIAPLDSLVAAVMEGVASPELLIPAGASHHTFTLKPSDMRRLLGADLVVWIGRPLERFLIKPLTTLDQTTARMAVAEISGVTLLPVRQGGVWINSKDTPGRLNNTIDPHLWLNPANARVIVRRLAQRLGKIDATNARRYKINADQTIKRLSQLDMQLKRTLAPVEHVPYIVFHDAYHYFEERYGLHSVGSITTDSEVSPGARRILEIRELIDSQHIRCVFSEPQFQSALVSTVLENTDARRGVLDSTGAGISPGPDGYFKLMKRLANSLIKCLQTGNKADR